MHIWTVTVSIPGQVTALTYIDDRSYWSYRDSFPGVLHMAAQRSKLFDEVFHLRSDPAKSAVVSTEGCAQVLADSLGYELKQDFALLGLVHSLDPSVPCKLQKFTLEKAAALIRYIPGVARSPAGVAHHLRALVCSLASWAGGLARPNSDEMKSLKNHFRQAFRTLTHETPPALFHEIMEWLTSVGYVLDCATLQAVARFAVRPPRWQDFAGLDVGSLSWMQLLPTGLELFGRMQWTPFADGSGFSFLDSQDRLRSLHFGDDSLKVATAWLKDCYRRKALRACGRTSRSLHGDGEGLAQGLLLPGPDRDRVVLAAGHKKVWRSQSSLRDAKLAALASGGNYWHFTKKLGADSDLCLCGLREPSRAHLAWVCDATHSTRAGLRMPRCRCEERLLAVPVRSWPPPPFVLDFNDFRTELVEALLTVINLREEVFVACDGSSRDDVSAIGFYLPQADASLACGVPGEDGSPFKAELFAIDTLLRAFEISAASIVRHVVFIVDCEAAVQVFHGGFSQVLPALAFSVHHRGGEHFVRGELRSMPFGCLLMGASGVGRLAMTLHLGGDGIRLPMTLPELRCYGGGTVACVLIMLLNGPQLFGGKSLPCLLVLVLGRPTPPLCCDPCLRASMDWTVHRTRYPCTYYYYYYYYYCYCYCYYYYYCYCYYYYYGHVACEWILPQV